MKSILTPVIALLIAASAALAQLVINTPTLGATECETLQITFGGGTPPYIVNIVDGNNPKTVIETFPPVSASPIGWFCNLQGRFTMLGLAITDATGTFVQSAGFIINAAPPGAGSCDTTTFSFSAQTVSGLATTTTGGSTATGPGSVALGPGLTSTSSGTSHASTEPLTGGTATSTGKAGASSSGTSPTSTKSAGASRVTGQIAAAGIIGAAMVALFG